MMGFNELNEIYGLVSDKIAEITRHREELAETINGKHGYITEGDIDILTEIMEKELIRQNEMIQLLGKIKLEMKNVPHGTN